MTRSDPMNGYFYNPRPEYSYGPGCPYRGTCPIRNQCPYCPHQGESNGYMNYNMEMGYYQQNNGYGENPYTNISPMEYGNGNLYPTSENTHTNVSPEYYNYNNMSPLYNNFGYVNPEENIHSPWDNNRMYSPNENPLPIPCPYR